MPHSHQRLCLARGLFPAGFPVKILYAFISSYACYTRLPSWHPWFGHPNNIWRRIQIITLLITQFPSSSYRSLHLWSRHSQRPVSYTDVKTFRCSTGTYTSRARRSLSLPEPPLDVAAVEKRLIAELGEHVCVFERVCDQYAEHARTLRGSNHVLNWEQVFKWVEPASSDGTGRALPLLPPTLFNCLIFLKIFIALKFVVQRYTWIQE